MILIADSGSTRTQWRLINNKNIIDSFDSVGLNPYYIDKVEIRHILMNSFKSNIIKNINTLFFYCTGCINNTSKKIITKELKEIFHKSRILVESDLLAASRALFQDKNGLIAILGTGSSSCQYDGKKIIKTEPSLGYILGDEGSGSFLGKKLLETYYYNELPDSLHQLLRKNYNMEMNKVLNSVYRNSFPNKYLASFTKFLKENTHHPFIRNLIQNAFQNFFNKHIIKYDNYQNQRIGFVGSVAYYFSEILKETAKEYHVRIHNILKEPIDELVRYHLNYIVKKYVI